MEECYEEKKYDNDEAYHRTLFNEQKELYDLFNEKKITEDTFIKMFKLIYSWRWTEQRILKNGAVKNGKYRGCLYWSEAALKKAYGWDNIPDSYGIKQKISEDWLVHEHIVPRKVCLDYLLNAENPFEDDNLFNQMQNCLVGCVITRGQDKVLNKFRDNMPSDTDFMKIINPWERYQVVGIYDSIYKCDWECEGRSWVLTNCEIIGKNKHLEGIEK